MKKHEMVSNDSSWKLKKQAAIRSKFIFIPQEESAQRSAGFIKQQVGYLQLYKLSGLYQKERVLAGPAMFRMP